MWMNSVPNSSSVSKANAELKRAVDVAAAEAKDKAVNNAIASDRDLFLANRRAMAEKKYREAEAKRNEEQLARNRGSAS